ncbi:hypothetical protein JKP88DRAFT_354713, partial [Tribonema minus]
WPLQGRQRVLPERRAFQRHLLSCVRSSQAVAGSWSRGRRTSSASPARSGGHGRCSCSVAHTPADVIKTRLQVVAREGEATYRGISDCAAHIFAVTLWAYELLHKAVSSADPALQPRPPTNAPIEVGDYRDAFRRAHVSKRLDDIHNLIENLSNVK